MIYVGIIIISILAIYFFIKAKIDFISSQSFVMYKFVCDLPKFVYFSKKHSFFSSQPLVGKVKRDEIGIPLVQEILKEVHQEIQNPKQRMICTAEILTKVLAYRDLQEKMQIQIPITDQFDKNYLVTFEVNKVFEMWNKMPAFGLLPLDHQKRAYPILLFRGTDFSLTSKRSIASLISDLDIAGPGFHIFCDARKEIHEWLYNCKKVGNKARVMGFSLGGAFTSYTLILEHRLVANSHEQPSISFNSPGVMRRMFRKWSKMTNEKKVSYFVFITKNDLIPRYGSHIGHRYEISTSRILLPIHAHVTLMTAQREFMIVPLKSN